MTYVQSTVMVAVAEWIRTFPERRIRLTLTGVSTAAIVAISGIALEAIDADPLPRATIVPLSGRSYDAGFVSIAGGDAYIVRNRELTVVSGSGLESVTISKPPKKPDRRTPSIVDRIF